MQKVITITSQINTGSLLHDFSEQEYPILNKYLENGYKITETITINNQYTSSETHYYAIVFILTKVNT